MELKNIIKIIKTGDKEAVKIAKEALKRFCSDNMKDKKAFLPIIKEMKNLDQIGDVDRQATFVYVLSWFFFLIGRSYLKEVKSFMLKTILSESGKLRQAVVRSTTNTVLDLDMFSSAGDEKDISKEKARLMKQHRLWFCSLVEDIEDLVEKYSEPRFNRYKYVASMPVSVCKSLELLLNELLSSQRREDIYNEYRYNKQKQEINQTRDDILGNNLVLKTQEQAEKEQKWDYYYDAMEHLSLGDTGMAIMLLKKAIKLDNDFVAGFMGITSAYRTVGHKENLKAYTNLAYQKTRQAFPKWPKEMPWGIIEHRQYLRAICDKACLCQKEGNLQKAEELYRLLLKLNPGDNQGVRYLIAGMFAGMLPEQVNDLFDEGNAKQDWSKLEGLLDRENKKHHFWFPPNFEH